MFFERRHHVHVNIVFRIFSIIFWLRRYSKILKIYCKNLVILNIRIFHSHDATIQNSIEKSFKKQLKNQWKLVQKRVQNPTPCRGSFLEPFWLHIGSILDTISFPKPFRIALGSSRDASRKWLWFRISFAGSAGGSWRGADAALTRLAVAAAFESQRHSGQKCCKNEGGSGGGEKRSP